jgi:hypothetical protein
MEMDLQIKLVDDLIMQRRDRTVRDFMRIKGELEKWEPSMQRITQNVIDSEKAPTVTSRPFNND